MASVVRVTSDDHHVRIECHRLAFGGEGLQHLARFRSPRNQMTCGNVVVVKRMQRLTPFDHHEVRDIDNVVDGPNAGCLETLLHPSWRRANLDILQKDRHEPRAQSRVVDCHAQWLV